ncbi:uncharacterized protein LOC116415680 [Nasonia vitripennis]|uniref:CHK kinase-like domain-containing protein n=1 Tax=Nasonia vitripennis TaxID=7425 RepID=A0A7M7QXN2_NASVI|nr:uncharacterized protein LOC116415680 [Nasonia vitripennis]XP_031782548.1 uncharacterized protein LOC116415680 [Nasonia vitripennis]XP_031782550.1 uncharacterized protein LOC116415680 [Nasonia vitripennis]XP_031782551.1 uncharacterized protein LOC116415680 [Nasonia vitripennis]XP_031782552.1 uncharacterized protein LOC116415680 [Nasonia vitripennis]XP_031782553.1 uncharacterized protein LOC116415680 [Nasonia vitripennis]XP_032454335.1 uncharacterized protein LOC116415680 [Nasonia vitripenni
MSGKNAKDVSLLKRVSIYFTEDVLKKVVAPENPNNVEILSWDFGDASAKGDSYMSIVDRVTILSKIDGKIVETRIVVKSLPQNKARRITFRSVEFFDTEIIFYTEIAPRFEKYLKSKGKSDFLNIPRCLAYHHDKENDFLVLQDVGLLGYGPLCRQASLSYKQCKCVAESLARFHAISFGFKHENPEEYAKMADMLTETFYREDIYENWYNRFFDTVLTRIAKDALAKEYPGSKGEKVFNSYGPGALVRKSIELCHRKHEPTAVIGQGDAWAPNFLARENESGKIEALMLDFQLARSASPVIDLSFFIYACTDQRMRDKYYEKILDDYYNELVKSVKLLGVDPDVVYPRDVFQKEIKEQSVCGFTFALEAVPFTMMPPEEAFDLDQIKEDQVDISDVWTLPNIKSAENRRRHAEMILNAVDSGFI